MTRRLALLNLLLLALTVLAAWQLRREWVEARARESAMLGKPVRPVPPPPAAEPEAPAPLTPAAYIDIAEKMLFTKDRNPTVVVEAAPAPPPKPMPPLPIFHGAMNLGDGPVAILSENEKAPHRDYRPGQPVGDFTLISISPREVVLEWEGKQVSKRLEELAASREAPAAAGRTEAPKPSPAAKPKVQAGPGVDVGKGFRACVPNDSTPPGTIVDGVRKVVTDSPFGQVCRWEPVQ